MSLISIQRLARSMGLEARISIVADVLRSTSAARSERSLRTEALASISKDTIDLAFVTQGDTRPLLDNQDKVFNTRGIHTNSEIWQLRAADLPKVFNRLGSDDLYPRASTPKVQIESVFDVDGAEKVVDDLPTELRLRNVFFLGHGSATLGFIFSGQPMGPGTLDVLEPHGNTSVLNLSLAHALDNSFTDRNTRFLRAMRTRLAPGYCGIWFLSCFTGLSELPGAVAAFLQRTGRREFFVGAYENFYQVNVGGIYRGQTTTDVVIARQTESFRVRKLRRFVGWNDRILNDSGAVVGRSQRNSVPRFEVLDAHGKLPFEHPEVLAPRQP